MLGFLQLAVWICGAALEVLVFIVALRSRLYRIHPAFTAFLAWQAVKNLPGAATFVLKDKTYYSYVFWTFETVSWALLFFVLAELSRVSLREYPAIVRLTRNFVFGFGGTFLITMLFVWVFARVSPWPHDWQHHWLLLMAGSIYWVQAGLLLGLVTFLQWFRVPTSFLFRCIIGGLLVNGVVRFVAAWLRNELGAPAREWASLGRASAFAAIVLFWLWALWNQKRYEPPGTAARLLSEADSALVLDRLSRLNDRLRVN